MFESLGNAVRQAVQDQKPEEARRLLLEATSDARESGDTLQTVRALRALAQIEEHLGNHASVLRLYEEAVVAARELDDKKLVAHTVRHLADILRRAGDYETARPYYEEALALYRLDAATPPGELANALRPMALLMEAVGDMEAARADWRAAREFYDRAGVKAGVAECAAALNRLDQLGPDA